MKKFIKSMIQSANSSSIVLNMLEQPLKISIGLNQFALEVAKEGLNRSKKIKRD